MNTSRKAFIIEKLGAPIVNIILLGVSSCQRDTIDIHFSRYYIASHHESAIKLKMEWKNLTFCSYGNQPSLDWEHNWHFFN